MPNANGFRLQGAITICLTLSMAIGCGGAGNQETNAANSSFVGCYAANSTSGNVGCGLASSLGDPNSDIVFLTEIGTQSQFWQGIPAAVHPWNDCNGANAESFPSGDILYGLSLFHQLVASYGGDAAPISGVLAHEWGHQIQFDNGWFTSSESTSRPIELEADAFSGFYMALSSDAYSWNEINNYFAAVASTGDFNFNEPNHHGTPQERLAAAQLGFQTAYQVIQTQTPLTYADLHQIFSTAIGAFDAKGARLETENSLVAEEFLTRLDHAAILDILKGHNRGRDVSVPIVRDRESLYPKK